VLIPHNPGSGTKVSRPVVIAETLPGVEDVVLRSARNRREIRKPAEPFIIIRDYSDDLGLLKHEFGDQNRIGISGLAPR